jgi:hypothetical protein
VAIGGVILVLSGVSSCGRSSDVDEEEIRRAQSELEPFKLGIQAALRDALRTGGPESAIDVCKNMAPDMAAAHSVGGVAMGRTSHKLRNPANAPEPWVEPFIVEFLERGRDRTYRAVRLPDGSVGYVEPIYVRQVCLPCHGKEISPAVEEKLNKLYQHDNGRGFEAGDFGGLFWVRIPPSKRG